MLSFHQFIDICTVPLSDRLLIKLKASSSENLETGGSLWHAGYALAHYLTQNPDLVRNKHVLELGCGCGLVGLTAACLGTTA